MSKQGAQSISIPHASAIPKKDFHKSSLGGGRETRFDKVGLNEMQTSYV